MHKVMECAIDVLPALTKNGQVQIDGALSVLIHNAGAPDAVINGNLTIAAGSTMQIAMPHPGVVINDYLTVEFDATVGARLEIVMTRLKAKKYSNFS